MWSGTELRIVQERADDRDAIASLHLAAFGEHGAVVNGVVDAFRRRPSEVCTSLVATLRDAVVGHVVVSSGLLDAPARLVRIGVLSPLAVLPDHQRTGIGARLVAEALARADATGLPLVFLEGDPAYYGRLGFRAARDLAFRKPSLRIPDAAFQVATLSRYDTASTGTLVYPSVFWEQDAVGLR